MENLRLNLGETPKHTIVAKHGIILSQSYGQKFGHAHKMNHNSNNHNNNGSNNNHHSKVSGDHEHYHNHNYNNSHSHQIQMQQMQIEMERALNGDSSLSLGSHYDSSSSGSNAGGGGGQGQGHHFNYTHGQTYAHGMDNGDSLAVVSSMLEMKSRTQSSYHHSTSPSETAVDSLSAAVEASSSYLFNPQVELAANSTLNASASAYNLHGGGSVAAMQQHFGLGSNSQQQQQYQDLLQTPQHHRHEHQLHQQHSPHEQQQQTQTHLGLLPKPTYSAPSQFGSNTQSEPCDFQLNVGAASFTPSRSQGLLGLPISSQSQPLLQTPHVVSSQVLVQKSGHGNGRGHGQNSRWRRQPLQDLFNAVLSLMRELNRSVSYPEIISTLSIRLQRTEADLKRHVPHTLHSAVTNGYLRKDGNRYTLLSELEQVEIMRRNQEAAQRAKELEKEPLSWRKR